MYQQILKMQFDNFAEWVKNQVVLRQILLKII